MKKSLSLFCVLTTMTVAAAVLACEAPRLKQEQKKESEQQYVQRYFYSFDRKTYILEVVGKVVLSFHKENKSQIEQFLQNCDKVKQIQTQSASNLFILTVENPDMNELRTLFTGVAGVKSVNPLYIMDDGIGNEMYLTDQFVVNFKKEVSQQQIDEIHKKCFVNIEDDPYQYLFEETRQLLSVPIDRDVLETANAYQESGLVEYSQPNFIAKMDRFDE